MLTRPAYYFHATLSRLRRNPVLTAMMVCSLVFGISTLIAGIKVWRVSYTCTMAQMSAAPSVVQDVMDGAGRSELLVRQPARADLDIGVRQTDSDSALARKVASACPCAAAAEWHWKPI
jgi:hypothetical protein